MSHATGEYLDTRGTDQPTLTSQSGISPKVALCWSHSVSLSALQTTSETCGSTSMRAAIRFHLASKIGLPLIWQTILTIVSPGKRCRTLLFRTFSPLFSGDVVSKSQANTRTPNNLEVEASCTPLPCFPKSSPLPYLPLAAAFCHPSTPSLLFPTPLAACTARVNAKANSTFIPGQQSTSTSFCDSLVSILRLSLTLGG